MGFTSGITIQEILKSSKQRSKELTDLITWLDIEILPDHEEIGALAQEYIKAGIIPAKYRNDALHIATATYYEMDIIITWNFEHMIKLKTKKAVPSLNVLMGYKPIEFISPLEVIYDDKI